MTGVSGSGKSSLVSQSLVELVAEHLGHDTEADDAADPDGIDLERAPAAPTVGRITSGMDEIKRLVRVDQRPIGRTPRSNLATYTGLFDHVRKLFAATKDGSGQALRRGTVFLQRGEGQMRNLPG